MGWWLLREFVGWRYLCWGWVGSGRTGGYFWWAGREVWRGSAWWLVDVLVWLGAGGCLGVLRPDGKFGMACRTGDGGLILQSWMTGLVLQRCTTKLMLPFHALFGQKMSGAARIRASSHSRWPQHPRHFWCCSPSTSQHDHLWSSKIVGPCLNKDNAEIVAWSHNSTWCTRSMSAVSQISSWRLRGLNVCGVEYMYHGLIEFSCFTCDITFQTSNVWKAAYTSGALCGSSSLTEWTSRAIVSTSNMTFSHT